MIEFALPSVMTEDFITKIPQQRLKVNELMEQGKIYSYALSADRQKLWCVVKAQTEVEAMEIIAELPLISYLDPTVNELMFNNVASLQFPMFSLN